MPRIGQGPGGGSKRRIRTRLQKVDSSTTIVGRNRSKKHIPANWRELVIDYVALVCLNPAERRRGKKLMSFDKPVPPPLSSIPPGSLPTSVVLFTIDRNATTALYQRKIIDWCLANLDVRRWPTPEVKTTTGAGGEIFVATDLPIQGDLLGDVRNTFNPSRLGGVDEINWHHLESYVVRVGKAKRLGIRTRCGNPCPCRRLLPELWSLGWEMTY